METIIEEPEEYSRKSLTTRFKQLWNRFHQSTLLITDCSTIIIIALAAVVFSFEVLSDNLLDVFYTISHESESIAAAYTQILTDLRFAFLIIGGLFADCIYGRLPLLTYSFVGYTICIVSSLFFLSFFNPPFYLIFLFIIATSFSYGIVLCTLVTLLLNYHYLQSPFRSFNLQTALVKIILAYSCSTILVRSVMYFVSFLMGFRVLFLLSTSFILITCKLVVSIRYRLINIPLQGNPVKEYSHTCRVLSREYNYSILKPNQNVTKGNQILQQASTDYYSRSLSRDSLDGTPSILRSSSLECYYVTQEVSMPAGPFSLPNETAGNQGVTVKVLTPLKSAIGKNAILAEREEEEKNRETALLFQNGIRTNLIGQLLRMSRVFVITLLQIPFWFCLEYTHSVLQAQFNVISEIVKPSPLLFCYELFTPVTTGILGVLLLIVARTLQLTSRFKLTSLQMIGTGMGFLLVTMVLLIGINIALFASSRHFSIAILFFPALSLAMSEVFLLMGSLLFYYQEAPRRAQAIFVALYAFSRYCGSLLFYVLLPVLNMLGENESGNGLHYELPIVVTFVLVVVLLVGHCSYAKQYCYVTERELDAECEALKAERILHPYLIRFDPFKKNRSKSYESSSSSSKTSLSDRSMSDEVILMNSVSRSISTAL